ncbi:siderophore-interacting protein [Larkinella rosea]|uniref:Siderophore-interacting protein n=1 Tax=Larkinella rosea TaxID=2025312 RepID=A0A3P1BUU9_9BACT|nr:siderophore-interacting protein [Larkinella rosea]RRB04643.1 siderophore-interacting protein [Larkinella rosea]
MPKIPKMVADAMESVFKSLIHSVEVQEVDYIHPKFKKIVFAGDNLKGLKYRPGWEIEIRVSDTDFRHYTPSFFDSAEGICAVLIYLHGLGPGSDWADSLQPGNRVKLIGPGRKIELDTSHQNYVFLGDETTIGLFLELQRGLAPHQKLNGVIEVDACLGELPRMAGLRLDAAQRTKKPGEALLEWLDIKIDNLRQSVFYVSGHAQTIQQIRRYLKEQGVSSRQLITRPYWADGKRGL